MPVSVAGIEADALISDEVSYSADIPEYPVEKGYNVSDSIILKPVSLSLTLYISDTPVTWRARKGHKPSPGRTKKICNKFEKLYFQRKLVKVVTTDAIYTNMGITSMTISHSKELGYSRQISISLKKVYITQRKTTKIPKHVLQSGASSANAGKAGTSSSSANAGSSSESGGGSSSKSSSSSSNSKKKGSILYGIANQAGFI